MIIPSDKQQIKLTRLTASQLTVQLLFHTIIRQIRVDLMYALTQSRYRTTFICRVLFSFTIHSALGVVLFVAQVYYRLRGETTMDLLEIKIMEKVILRIVTIIGNN